MTDPKLSPNLHFPGQAPAADPAEALEAALEAAPRVVSGVGLATCSAEAVRAAARWGAWVAAVPPAEAVARSPT